MTDMDVDERKRGPEDVDSDGFSRGSGSDVDVDDPPPRVNDSVRLSLPRYEPPGAGDEMPPPPPRTADGGAASPSASTPSVPIISLGGVGAGGSGSGGGLTSRKPPGLGLNVSATSNPDTPPTGVTMPSPSGSGGSSGGNKPPRLSLSGGNRPLGLDLDALRDSDPDSRPMSELQIRREKFSHFEKHCTQITEGLYVAGDLVAKNRATLDEHGITHVINCVGFLIPNYFEGDMTYFPLWLHDTPNEDIICVVYDCIDYVRTSHRSHDGQGRTLVHCSQGVSRSVSIAIAYVMWKDGGNYDETFKVVKARRGIANPNIGFTSQILIWDKRRRTESLPGGGVDRLYVIAPQSEHDPKYLVAKQVTIGGGDGGKIGVELLDSRCVFVFQTKSGVVYVWLGKDSESKGKEWRTRGETFARQLREYERVTPGTMVLVRQGEENAEFLAALGGGGGASAKNEATASVGVNASYDADFDLYEKGVRSAVAARSGAAIPAPEWARALTRAHGGAPPGAGGSATLTKGWSLSERSSAPSGHFPPVGLNQPGYQDDGGDGASTARPFRRYLSVPTGGGGGGAEDVDDDAFAAASEAAATKVAEDGFAPTDDVPLSARVSDMTRLLDYPAMDVLGVYDEDDLDSSGVFILVERGEKSLRVWVGEDATQGDAWIDGEDVEVAAERIGRACAKKLELMDACEITLEREGNESDAFWEAFEAGQ